MVTNQKEKETKKKIKTARPDEKRTNLIKTLFNNHIECYHIRQQNPEREPEPDPEPQPEPQPEPELELEDDVSTENQDYLRYINPAMLNTVSTNQYEDTRDTRDTRDLGSLKARSDEFFSPRPTYDQAMLNTVSSNQDSSLLFSPQFNTSQGSDQKLDMSRSSSTLSDDLEKGGGIKNKLNNKKYHIKSPIQLKKKYKKKIKSNRKTKSNNKLTKRNLNKY